jgi:predicted ATPase with chaperone activity
MDLPSGRPAIVLFAAKSLTQIANHFNGTQLLSRPQPRMHEVPEARLDLRDIKGHESAKRALEIAAAVGHHLLRNRPAPRSLKSDQWQASSRACFVGARS